MDTLKSISQLGSKRRYRGLELVESAIILPLIVLVLFGIFEYGFMFFQQEQITNIARETARVAATPAGSTTYQDTFSTLKSQAGSLYNNLSITDQSNVGGPAGSLLTITVSEPYKALTGTSLIPLPKTLSATVSMMNEGP